MLSTFQATTSMCVPERCTVVFGPSVKRSAVVEQTEAPGSHVAIVLKIVLLNVPARPAAVFHVAAFHDTSLAVQVVAPATGGVNVAAFAFNESRSCLVADDSTIWSIVTAAAIAAVATPTFVTLNVMPAGTATLACSLTVTDTVVVWLVSGSTTVVCADADPLHITPTMRAATGHRINRT